jgi:hypothetical protein
MRKKSSASLLPSCYMLNVSARRSDDSLNTEHMLGDKSYLVTIDTGTSLTITRPDISAQERTNLATCPVDGVRETVPVVTEVPVELILGLHLLQAWTFITKITNEFILRLDVLLYPRRLRGIDMPRAMTGQGRNSIVVPQA